MPEQMYVIAVGNIVEGFTLCGLFNSGDEAAEYANHAQFDNPWHIMEIQPKFQADADTVEADRIFKEVLAAMQPAEDNELPDGQAYCDLMARIAKEATSRASTFKALAATQFDGDGWWSK
jgi:hypothetical protein